MNLHNKTIASFDIKFTNIPLNETIDIITTKLSNNSPSYTETIQRLVGTSYKRVSISI